MTDEQLTELLSQFGHAWHRWEQADSAAAMYALGRAREEAERAIRDAFRDLNTELATVRAERDRLRARLTDAELFVPQRELAIMRRAWAGREQSADAPSEPNPAGGGG